MNFFKKDDEKKNTAAEEFYKRLYLPKYKNKIEEAVVFFIKGISQLLQAKGNLLASPRIHKTKEIVQEIKNSVLSEFEVLLKRIPKNIEEVYKHTIKYISTLIEDHEKKLKTMSLLDQTKELSKFNLEHNFEIIAYKIEVGKKLDNFEIEKLSTQIEYLALKHLKNRIEKKQYLPDS